MDVAKVPFSEASVKNIQLSNGEITKVDSDIYDKYHNYSWRVDQSKGNYVITSIKKKTIRLHRLIMGATTGELIDHIDGNTHNNLRSNLRFATGTQNQGNRKINKNNTSGYRGVVWNYMFHKWQAQIKNKNQLIILGYFHNKTKAAQRYNDEATKYFGEFAQLNQI